jgi:hypothetical protein
MNYDELATGLIQRLESKGYNLTKPTEPLDFALIKQGALMQTYVVAVRDAFAGAEEPAVTFDRTENWFRSVYGNNGGGLLIFVYREAPAWAVEQIKNGGSGGVKGGVIDLNSGYRWITSHLGWDSEIGI